MKVAKFGGSSVASARQIQKVGSIIRKDPLRKVIVVSAPGKRHGEDMKVTDLLIGLGNAYLENRDYDMYMQFVMDRFSEIVSELDLDTGVLTTIQENISNVLFSDYSNELKLDAIKAIGEDSSARILSAYLNRIGLEAIYMNPKEAGIIVSDEPGNAQILDESFSKLRQLRNKQEIIVIPGFFGYTKTGKLSTFSRGGSDITGSIVAAGVQAELYENFTDVDSVYTVNPTLVRNPAEITVLTYKEMRELSYAGFSVFHDEALIPAIKEKIPVAIKNTNNPDAPGTKIVAEREINGTCVVGIASDTGFSSLYVSKYLMNRELGFGRKLFHILEEESISFEHAPSGIDDLSVIIRDNQLTKEKESTIIDRIKTLLQAETVKFTHNLAVIMIVGEGMLNTIGIAQKATTALVNANVNIEMINQGSSEVSMMFGIQAKDMERAVQSLYQIFFQA
ncbi:aspartate kinase [Ornithinibacillus gellani]|uniref:aspartate kinase n=1 Tax=Ornithinibacillus gellani TaxID=2293253 RepID=UPI000F478236|nr:aspartate kinase [Ornithinibacillus gellani]TQS74501.1 aspartate kinase [Ornithinibacillus gellani]